MRTRLLSVATGDRAMPLGYSGRGICARPQGQRSLGNSLDAAPSLLMRRLSDRGELWWRARCHTGRGRMCGRLWRR